MGMVAEEQQSFEDLEEDLPDSFHSGKSLSELISNIYSWSQKNQETEDAFPNDLQVWPVKNCTDTIISFRGQAPTKGSVCTQPTGPI